MAVLSAYAFWPFHEFFASDSNHQHPKLILFHVFVSQVGPMAFDVGCLIGNILLAFIVSSESDRQQHGVEGSGRSGRVVGEDRRGWILEAVKRFWVRFSSEMRSQALSSESFGLHSEGEIANWMKELWDGSLGFAAICMVRLTIGQLHYPPLEALPAKSILNCSLRILWLAESILTLPPTDVHDLVEIVREAMDKDLKVNVQL